MIKIKNFIKKKNKTKIVSLNTYFDPTLNLAKQFKLIGMPTTILLDKDGNEFGRIMGEFDFSEKNFMNLLRVLNQS